MEDIVGKPVTQINVVILYPNCEVAVRKSFDKSTKSVITNLALKNWKAAANHACIRHIPAFHTMEAIRIAEYPSDLISSSSSFIYLP